jgi:hypothetical protein
MTTHPEPSHPSADYSYPVDLARFVQARWADTPESSGGPTLLPDAALLEQFFSGCYQASLLRDEERAVTFRAILAAPMLFTSNERPPTGLLSLEFAQMRPFTPSELRRLMGAADPYRTLIGVFPDEQGVLRIWGVINSGTRWLRHVQGGRLEGPALPLAPVAYVRSPGRLEVYKGYELVAQLQGGNLSVSRMDVFDSKWLPNAFTDFTADIGTRHAKAQKRAEELSGERWAPLEPELTRQIAERMLKRVIALVRDSRHGGTIIFIPEESSQEASSESALIDLKYRIADSEPRRFFPQLLVDILNRLAQIYGPSTDGHLVGWREFETTTDDEVTLLEEGLFEFAHLMAGLAAVDGAVVIGKHHELLGFGGMISGRLPELTRVARGLDLEGERVVEEETGTVGARHRSAYRLVSALPGAIAIVVSQDGGVRFVGQKDGRVTYWEQE